MKAIIPVAGEGTRLRPQTHSLPKSLVGVAGKPILGHILDQLVRYDIHEIILVIGYLGEKIVQYIRENYSFTLDFVTQKQLLGLGHAIHMTRDFINDEPTLIVYGDTLFEADLASFLGGDTTYIGVKQVEDWRRFGVVIHEGNRITRFVEKPQEPVSDLAIVGINYIAHTPALFNALEKLLAEGQTTKGEYQLTDAFQIMLDEGEDMRLFEVEGWYDCGKPEALLETNRALLRHAPAPSNCEGSVLIPPVFVAESAEIKNCILGPNVSIDDGAKVTESILQDTIVSQEARVADIVLEKSIIGPNAVVKGQRSQLNVGDSSIIDFQYRR